MTNRFEIIGVFVGIVGLLAFVALQLYYKKPHELAETLTVFLSCSGTVGALDCGRLLLRQQLSKKNDLGALQNHWYILVFGVLAFIGVAIESLVKMVLAVITYTP